MTAQIDHTLDGLIKCIIMQESSNNPYAKGDAGAAWGIMQIQQGCLTDVNRYLGTGFTLQQVFGANGVELSKIVFSTYMHIYATERRLGRPVTDQDRARTWNGGPNGWRKKSTLGYWVAIMKHAQKMGITLV